MVGEQQRVPGAAWSWEHSHLEPPHPWVCQGGPQDGSPTSDVDFGEPAGSGNVNAANNRLNGDAEAEEPQKEN